MKILAIYGSTHQDGNSRVLAHTIGESAHHSGADIIYFDVLQKELPLFRTDRDFKDHPVVNEIRSLAAEVDAFIVVSPEYHGCMSNAIKNFFDFHYQQFAGKAFAIATATGGSMGVSCNSQMRIAIQHCHGWALPYQVGVKSSEFSEGKVINEKAHDRLLRLGRDLVVYGELLQTQFKADKNLVNPAETGSESPVNIGFAGWYV
jgi:NAD(P)H-dependent FMN reductase